MKYMAPARFIQIFGLLIPIYISLKTLQMRRERFFRFSRRRTPHTLLYDPFGISTMAKLRQQVKSFQERLRIRFRYYQPLKI